MNCPKCNATLPDQAKFCLECGAATGMSGASGQEADVSLGGLPTMAAGAPRDVAGAAEISIGGMLTMATAPAAQTSAGQVLAERYELLEEIGRGGFATVWKARDRKLDRVVAVKRLLPTAVEGPLGRQTLERFAREAASIAQLSHRNIVQVFDHDRDGEARYVVMEYIGGGSLRDRLKAHGGKLPVEEAVELVKGIARGLAYAHRKNLVHRDIKPANILLAPPEIDAVSPKYPKPNTQYPVPKIVDFGLARMGSDSEVSQSGYGMGTPWYMPPEQRRNAKGVNHTADIYALGKTLYELVSGETPDNVDPEKLPPALAKIILKCCKSNPEERFFSCEELLAALEEGGIGCSVLGIGRSGRVPQGSRSLSPNTEYPIPNTDNVCPACGAANAPDVKFCESCGAGMTRLCPECERENSVHKQFCGGCGTEVEGFLKWQEALARMEKAAGEKRWSRVIKEAELLDETPVRLPGKKGHALQAQATTRRSQAETTLKTIEQLRSELGAQLETGNFTAADETLKRLLELDPHDSALTALADKIKQVLSIIQHAAKAANAANRPAVQAALMQLRAIKGLEENVEPVSTAIEQRLRECEHLRQVDREKAVSLRCKAMEELEARRPDQAHKLWIQAEELDKGGGAPADGARIVAAMDRVAELLKQAQIAMSYGKVTQALVLAQEALKHQLDCDGAQKIISICKSQLRLKKIRITALLVFVISIISCFLWTEVFEPRYSAKRDAQKINKWQTTSLTAAKRAKDAGRWQDCLNQASHVLTLESARPREPGSTPSTAFTEAQSLKREAEAEVNRQAEERRVREEQVRQAKVAAALTAAKEAKAAGRFQVCFDKATEVLALEGERPREPGAAPSPAVAEATALKREAERNLVPTLIIAAEAGGREVAAEVSDGRQAWQTPATISLRAGVAYHFTVTYSPPSTQYPIPDTKYRPVNFSFKADWRGPQTRRVTLHKEPDAGDTQTVDLGGGVRLELVWCPAGSFTMGSPSSEAGRVSDETQHRVTLTKGFWMGKCEVTQGQWEAVMGINPSNFKNAGRMAPVEQVSWDDCQEFVRKVNARVAGGGFRLPTEAEWEYACRAGTASALNSGKELTSTTGRCLNLDEAAWYGETSGGTTHPVGERQPNAWGLYDMHGNVWEWCADWYGEYPSGIATDPLGPGSGSYRVRRGGSWFDYARFCRSADRGGRDPGFRSLNLGLRLARSPQ